MLAIFKNLWYIDHAETKFTEKKNYNKCTYKQQTITMNLPFILKYP